MVSASPFAKMTYTTTGFDREWTIHNLALHLKYTRNYYCLSFSKERTFLSVYMLDVYTSCLAKICSSKSFNCFYLKYSKEKFGFPIN